MGLNIDKKTKTKIILIATKGALNLFYIDKLYPTFHLYH